MSELLHLENKVKMLEEKIKAIEKRLEEVEDRAESAERKVGDVEDNLEYLTGVVNSLIPEEED
jgi:predicted  nucleic acid-binding Zn-ribbon protein